jgi:L-alanine-DL-glutamate epimerase-like enolase superfamily enzyme
MSTTITDVETVEFTYQSHRVTDEKGESHPGGPREAVQTLTRVVTADGATGLSVGGGREANEFATDYLAGEDALEREQLWRELSQLQRLNKTTIPDRHVAAIDNALWDLAGKEYGAPVYELLGGHRERIPAYASTMVGDDDPDGLGTPEAYADFAEAKVEGDGYPAFKLHTWFPPYGADPDRDLAACRAVRERVGPDVDLMLDSYHFYSRAEALRLGRGLEELDYRWFEEPMNEHSTTSYEWLTRELDIPVIGPETAEGKMQTRAEWIKRDACDMSRVGVWDVGGITPALKTVNLCESFGVRCEIHGGGAANLHLLASMAHPGEYYERGLLHPKFDYEAATPWLERVVDPLDGDGHVRVPQSPGLGYDVDWEFVEANRIER